MRQDQLERARQTRWRQDGNALLTLDDAERWLADTPLCLYLPRRAHMPVPAPSFVEAIAGKADVTPGPESLAAAAEMLARLVASGAVVALNLFGAASGLSGEQPDFLATPEALPYLFALQPERNAKRGPSSTGSSRVSPLSVEVWKTLEREGALTTGDLRQRLGREVTEAAVLRAIGELWHTMRVVLVPAEAGASAHWELLQSRHRRELTIGSTQSQTTALSILASFYLQSAVAATGEDVEIFLSPVASRSRIRDVVHGLSATRQLGSFPLDGDGQLYVEGSLPEIPEDAVAPAAEDAGLEDAGLEDAGLEENEPSFTEAAGIAVEPMSADAPVKRVYTPRPAFGDRARTGFGARGRSAPSADRPPSREGSFRKPAAGGFRRRAEGGAGADRPRSTAPRTDRPRSERPPRTNRFTSSGAERRPAVGFRGPRPTARPADTGAPREPGGLEDVRRPNFARGPARSGGSGRPAGRSGPGRGGPTRSDSGAGSRPPFRKSADGAGRPPRAGGDRPFRKREGESDRPRSFARPTGEGPSGGAGDRPYKKPYAPRTDRPGANRSGTDGPSPSRPSTDRPFKKPYAAKKPYGSKPFAPRSFSSGSSGTDRPANARTAAAGDGAPRRSFTPRPEGGERREGAERRPYTPQTGGPPRGKGPGAGSRPSFGARPSARSGSRPGGRPAAGGFGGARRPAGAGRPPFSGGTRSSAPRSSAPRSSAPRPTGPREEGAAPRERSPRPGGFGKPGGFNKPGSFSKGPGKPGGYKKAGGSFGKPGGAPKRFGAPRPGGAGRPAGAGRPPAKGGFSGGAKRSSAPRTGGPRPAGSRPTGPRPGGARTGGARPAGKRPGGFGPPTRKPRSTGDEG